MFITLRKWTVIYAFSLTALMIVFALIMQQGAVYASVPAIQSAGDSIALIIDPGHGGEDGGAVAADGTVESEINLIVGLLSSDLARFLGWEVCMTRETDISIHDSSAQTLREKKVSDLKNRVKLCERIDNGVLISIHQNSIPSAKSVHGSHVFFNSNPGSKELAAAVQSELNRTLNAGHAKSAKNIGESSYLMKNVKIPAILIECGFLSNPEEAELLKDPSYQKKLAVCIVGAVAKHLKS